MVAPDPYVVDASAAVEYLLESELGWEVAALIAGVRLLAPEMLDAEALSALRQRALGGHITDAEALRALDKLSDWPVERVSHRTLTRVAWEFRHNVSAYDALYVAVARNYGATLITADRRLARAPGLGVVVRDVGGG